MLYEPLTLRSGAVVPNRIALGRAELLERSVSPVFIGYLTRWKNFVV